MIVLGIDPGATYTAFSVKDGDDLVFSATLANDKEGLPPFAWAARCVDFIKSDILPHYKVEAVGVENIQAPQVYINGKKSMINPKVLIPLAIVAGGIAILLSTTLPVVIVPAKKNGSGPDEDYPKGLIGRRPADLPGKTEAKVRKHEKSAYDVAGEVELMLNNNYHLDTLKED